MGVSSANPRARRRINPQRLQQVVLPEPLVALAAFHQRVTEILNVAAGLPSARVHEDGGVQPHHVVAPGDDRPPPGLLDVALQLHAQRPVVPRRAEAAVNLAALEHETAALGKGQHLVHVCIGQRAGQGATS